MGKGSPHGGDMEPVQSLTLPGRYDHIQTFCEFVRDAAASVGFDPHAQFQLELACDEACTNVIEHAYGGEDLGEITVRWGFEAPDFAITISDRGHAFDPRTVAKPNIPQAPTDWEALQIGGLGIHIMRKVMDSVRFSFDPTSGNELVMIKRLVGGANS